MKRIATIGAIITAFAVAPSVAAAGNVAAQAPQPQISAQVVSVHIANVQRAKAAVTLQRHVVQRHRVQIAAALRLAQLRAQVR